MPNAVQPKLSSNLTVHALVTTKLMRLLFIRAPSTSCQPKGPRICGLFRRSLNEYLLSASGTLSLPTLPSPPSSPALNWFT
ncbi:unnamed protein product [Protopolystoma xenopodis]|uniref:Uncharacterized protein n=1 Tax=Protopolystoma xenopodis TaxID=117903 RepID=A0A448WRK0_9PLAT|nr:unnamed protein product [Protopolystoma xenopodis]